MTADSPSKANADSNRQMSESEYALVQNLTTLYGEGQASYLAKRLMSIAMGEMLNARQPLPNKTPELTASDRMLICYGDSVRDTPNQPLNALKRFADQHLQTAISAIHILPFFPSSSDDGFAVIDYETVRSDLGDWSDIEKLADNFDLMFDLVINHCSRENLWFADFIGGRSPGCNYFHQMESAIGLDQVVRPRNSPLLTHVHTYQGIKRVWTTFSDDQVDLNFSNPEVLCAFIHILFSYIVKGARFVRLDAIAFLWKEINTTCINLEQTHCVVRILRALIEAMGTNTQLLTETNIPHKENVSYFGSQDEAHLIYQFSLAPLLLYSYLFNDGQHLGRWVEALAPAPTDCNFVNFIASHDGIGLRPLEGLVPESDIQRLTDKVHERGGYAAMRSGGNGEEKVYELNIALFSAFGGTHTDIPAYVAAHQLMMAFQGLPALYINALVGGSNDHQGVESSGRTRSINRGHWQLETLSDQLASPSDPQAIIFNALCHSLSVRGEQPAFAPSAQQTAIHCSEQHLCLLRQCDSQSIYVLASFSAQVSEYSLNLEALAVDLLTKQKLDLSEAISLDPYQVRWLALASG